MSEEDLENSNRLDIDLSDLKDSLLSNELLKVEARSSGLASARDNGGQSSTGDGNVDLRISQNSSR
jgi:hypothetical protein